ncbi:hypothetical protein A0H81_11266 [Grifola frondosa]|uniref:Uncharacterized protein n=1 Tax=Grifola frondosa TaxID=5627 RepID=A0A1C7LVS0_GRIFR|nr:hypothetical protein A0H81_11266 [Grifola frondosa]
MSNDGSKHDLRRRAEVEHRVRRRTRGRVAADRIQQVVHGDPGVDALVLAVHDHDARVVLQTKWILLAQTLADRI